MSVTGIRPRALLAGVVALLAGMLWLVPATSGALTGTLRNPANVTASGFYTCTSAAASVGPSSFFVWPLNDSGILSTSAADVSGNNRRGTYRNDTLLNNGVDYRVAGPCPRDSGQAARLSGANNGGYLTYDTVLPAPQVFSFAIWFRTSTADSTSGGKIMGFGSALTGNSTDNDRHLYMTDAGTLIAGVFPGSVKTITSPVNYRDNQWHHAVVTLAPATNPNPGFRLYVDGTLTASDPSVVSAQTYNGYWRIGYDNLNPSAWPNAPTRYYFGGSVAFAEVFTSALTPAQVYGLYAAGR